MSELPSTLYISILSVTTLSETKDLQCAVALAENHLALTVPSHNNPLTDLSLTQDDSMTISMLSGSAELGSCTLKLLPLISPQGSIDSEFLLAKPRSRHADDYSPARVHIRVQRDPMQTGVDAAAIQHRNYQEVVRQSD